MIDSFVCVDVILLLIIPRGFLGVGKKCKGGGGRQVLSSLLVDNKYILCNTVCWFLYNVLIKVSLLQTYLLFVAFFLWNTSTQITLTA